MGKRRITNQRLGWQRPTKCSLEHLGATEGERKQVPSTRLGPVGSTKNDSGGSRNTTRHGPTRATAPSDASSGVTQAPDQYKYTYPAPSKLVTPKYPRSKDTRTSDNRHGHPTPVEQASRAIVVGRRRRETQSGVLGFMEPVRME